MTTPQTERELLPCPGCGSDDTRVIGGPGTTGGPKHWAGCDHCRWRTWGNTEADAICAWNRRALTRPAAPDAVRGLVADVASKTGIDRSITELQRLVQLAADYDLDEIHLASLETAIESMQMRASAIAAPAVEEVEEVENVAEDAYYYMAEMLEPYVVNDGVGLPGSVSESFRMMLDHWVATKVAPAVDGGEWRCFHCDERFTDRDSAALHFGSTEMQSPACLIDVAEYRRMEALQASYADEDAAVHRTMRRMDTEHQQEVRRAEEAGYARGLKDSGLCPCAAPTPPADAEQRAQCRLTEAQGKDIRSIKVGEILTQDQWGAVCAFVREGDDVVNACQERIAELEERPAQVRGWLSTDNHRCKIEFTNLSHVADEWRRDKNRIVDPLYTTPPPAVDVAGKLQDLVDACPLETLGGVECVTIPMSALRPFLAQQPGVSK